MGRVLRPTKNVLYQLSYIGLFQMQKDVINVLDSPNDTITQLFIVEIDR